MECSDVAVHGRWGNGTVRKLVLMKLKS